MTNLTDAQINAALAEIEGWTFRDSRYWFSPDGANTYVLEEPPFLTEPRLWAPLIEKYNIIPDQLGVDEGYEWMAYSEDVCETADTPQRAICLAVIALHEGK